MINPRDWIYDLESYPNIFTAAFKHALTGQRCIFEISEWRDDHRKLLTFLYALRSAHCRMIGYNNIGYDYPLLHWVIHKYIPGFSHYEEIFNRSDEIISTPWENRFDNNISEKYTAVTQIDLYKIHHFDNKNRRTRLKMLEFNMRSESIEDLPYPPGTVLTFEESRNLISYNDHDVDETENFNMHSLDAIKFREELGRKYNRNFLNFNDVKIGKEYIINEMEKASPGSCYVWENGGRQARQTRRPYIDIGDVIFPYIKFNRPEFQMVHQWLMKQRVTKTKGVFTDKVEIIKMRQQLIDLGATGLSKKLPKSITTTIDGFNFTFGLGGIHGFGKSIVAITDDEYIIVEWDAKSFYPNIAIKNGLHPDHFDGTIFCRVYNETYQERTRHGKDTIENAALKLALNGGGFGGAGDEYCPIFDLQYMLGITVNGQLLLCMLAEYLLTIPNLQLIQVNTDGITVRCPREHEKQMIDICTWWDRFTCLELERTDYKRVFARDVNNYIAEYESGKLKRKGAYGHEIPLDNPNTRERQWHSDHSALVVPMAAEAALVRGESIENFIINHKNIFDFMLRTKINRSDTLMFNTTTEVQRISRYYVSNSPTAGTLLKLAPPPKGKLIGQFKRKNKLTNEYYDSVITELKQTPHNDIETDVTNLPWDERINNKKRTKYKIAETGLEVGYKVIICNKIEIAQRSDIDYSYYIKHAKKLVEILQ